MAYPAISERPNGFGDEAFLNQPMTAFMKQSLSLNIICIIRRADFGRKPRV
jgi:hypothetical protein